MIPASLLAMRRRNLTFCLGVWVLLAVAAAPAADRRPLDLNPATPEQMFGHHLVRSAQLGPLQSEDGLVNLMPWCEQHVGLTPEALEKCLTERLDVWAKAFDGVEHKLAWVGAGSDGGGGKLDYSGMGARVLDYAYDLGMGQRCGFVENYL